MLWVLLCLSLCVMLLATPLGFLTVKLELPYTFNAEPSERLNGETV